MKPKVLLILLALGLASTLHAAPNFWAVPSATATPPEPPPVQAVEEPVEYKTATPTPVIAPIAPPVSPTPTPQPGLSPKNPTQAALFSVVVPGSGQVYAGDPVK